MELIISILGYVLTPIVGAIGWVAGSKKRNNDFLKDLQDSIDLLSTRNKELLEEVIKLRSEVVKLKTENAALRAEVEELNRKLDNVKTITKEYKNENES